MLMPLIKGLATYIPGLYRTFSKHQTGGTISARYCYSVWMRHLLYLFDHNKKVVPSVVAELGPGDSLGIGLTALVSGAKRLYSLDIVDFSYEERNLAILDEIVDLFKDRARIPDNSEFPLVKPPLDSFEFPEDIFTDDYLDVVLSEERIEAIKHALIHEGNGDGGIEISYFVPWNDPEVIKTGSVDMIYSQAVLEHVDDLEFCYQALFKWLKTGGIMSHQIDFNSHQTAREWNGHWSYSDLIWKLIRGKRPFLINREPLSTHINLINKFGFKIIRKDRYKRQSGISRDRLTPRFRDMSNEDFNTSGIFIQARKL